MSFNTHLFYNGLSLGVYKLESSIYFNDLTVIDFSVINSEGQIVGGSATLNLELSGPVDNHEGVVVDFSAGKKQIKELIDGYGGFDHKCWVNVNDPNIIIEQNLARGTATVKHTVSNLIITAEEDAFSWVQDYHGTNDIQAFLNEKLAPYVVSNVALNTQIIPVPRSNTGSHVFRYVHGLKYSSSYGCKNLVHGHKSYISGVVDRPEDSARADIILSGIAKSLDGTIFADTEDATVDGLTYTVAYETAERGKMSMSFSQKFVVLETQTTVEHLVEYIRARYYDQLKAAGIKELYVSEGLCKGAKVLL